MPEPLDLEAIRSCVMEKWDITCGDELYRLSKAAQAMFAEIERLRTIAAPLERLEAWRQLDVVERTEVCVLRGAVYAKVLTAAYGNRDRQDIERRGDTIPAAITAALDAWEAAHGKDGP